MWGNTYSNFKIRRDLRAFQNPSECLRAVSLDEDFLEKLEVNQLLHDIRLEVFVDFFVIAEGTLWAVLEESGLEVNGLLSLNLANLESVSVVEVEDRRSF